MSNEPSGIHTSDTDTLLFRAPTIDSASEKMTRLVHLPDPTWAFWNWAALRSAGFPAQEALALATPACAQQADRLLLAPPTEQKQLSADFQKMFTSVQIDTFRTIQDTVRSKRFQEALIWQNRHAFHTGIAGLLQISPENTRHLSQRRQHEILVARYLQRYCMKNDTIGFFGPVGWIRVVNNTSIIGVQSGPDVLASRRVYFEQWCIHTLVQTIAQNPLFRLWLVPRRMPHLRLERTTLCFPFGRAIELSPLQARVFQACDGQHSACQIAIQVKDAAHEEIYHILEQFQAAHYILWTLDISPESSFPEQLLRQRLAEIGDESLRAMGLDMLNSLELAKDAVASACGDAERLDAALQSLDTTFSSLTATAPTRFHGKMYAGRTLVYEDCRRDIEMSLGAGFVQNLGHPLSLLLISARWFTYELARLYREAFSQAYQELTIQLGTSSIDFPSFWLWIQPLLFDEDKLLTKKLLPTFQQKWLGIFAGVKAKAESTRHVQYTTEELRSAVLASFATPRPGWRSARYHNPDIFIQAATVEDIRQDNYHMVLGEFHMATNTLQSQLFVLQHPSPQSLLDSMNADIPETRILPIVGREVFPGSRTRPGLAASKDIRYIYSSDAVAVPGAEVVPISEFLLGQTSEGLLARTRDHRWSFDIIEFVAEFLSQIAGDSFQIRAPGRHLPRITIDRLVVARESWSFRPAEIDFLAASMSQADSFIAARRWKHANDLPRFVFFKIPDETKPCFLDFDSPLYIENFRRMVRRTLRNEQHDIPVLISEMLPTPEQLWLSDAKGRRYTSEIRLIVVDQAKTFDSAANT